ncbi:oligoendopeptidase F [Pediococcus parvulus]|uniref:oligoendopeptidase F n=1 Tax=Pediococcus parvulus TaxID=54062 RepID=UPI00070D822C|nr:oligoendopeptidase F [Pediococcus parvulus]MCT3026623.1 oligoendopeptidase F [Pediococcus parvulus]GEL90106.1 oligoendopeptidase F [Pediococcus parvulus]GHC13468.1 oligoendopeptidase F [Pediococcus parvulus]
MAEIKQLPKRSDVPVELTWDLTTIFKDDRAVKTAMTQLKVGVQAVLTQQGKLQDSAQNLLKVIQDELNVQNQLEHLFVYAELKNDQDTGDNTNQGLKDQITGLVAKASAQLAWIEPEILAIPNQKLTEFQNNESELKPYEHFLAVLRLKKDHVLSAKEEAILAGASSIFGSSEKVFGILDNSDLKFPFVKNSAGQTVQLSQGMYSTLLQSTNQVVRKQAFEQLYAVYEQFRNTFAATLSGEVKVHNFNAQIRGFKDARQAAMSENTIPDAVYTNLVTEVNSHLDLLHRYVGLRKKILNLKEMHMYDLYTPITGKSPLSYTYQKAQTEAKEALQIMGDDYVSHVDEAFKNRWIDVVENQGKRSGAYSSGVYGTNPFMLLNWQDDLDNLFTLVHEMGHSMHTYYTTHNQPYQYGDYAIFVAEIASTTNENILTSYLLDKYDDPQIKLYVLNHYLDDFKGTVYRQTQFAEFEQFIHEADAKGEPLTAEMMSNYYGDLNHRYYGDAVINDDQIKSEWTRIPHFYYNFYVYQYATGFAAASSLANGITTHQAHARENYLNYLKSGSSDFPLNVMKKAGVDMTRKAYLEDAFAVFEKRLNEFESLL